MSIFSVCVYCGARSGVNPDYDQTAHDLGTALAKSDMRLVYGAGDIGLMGHVARSAQKAGGATFGVIPTHLLHDEIGKRDLDHFIITETMHERKKVMLMNANAIVVLPGGAGTLDEFFEALTWRQLGLHDKPIYVLDCAGYWAPLVELTSHIVTQGFADASLTDLFTVIGSTDDLMAQLRNDRNTQAHQI
jgi:uncharacterized protein (TIGR00730 family)